MPHAGIRRRSLVLVACLFALALVLLFAGGERSSLALPAPNDMSTTEAETTLTVVAAEGASTPVGGTFSSLTSELSINDFGHVVFRALVDGGSTPQAIFLYKDGELYKVVGVGDPAPTGGTFTFLQHPALNNHDQVVFAGKIGTTEGIFLASGGAIEEVVVAGDSTPVGGTYQGSFRSSSIGVGNGIVLPHINVNDSGDIGFGDKVLDGDVTGALFIWSEGATSKIAAIGEATPIGDSFFIIAGPRLNNLAQAGIMGWTTGRSEDPAGIFLDGATLLRNGVPSPAGSTIESVCCTPHVNDQGQAASWVRLADDREGIFLGDGSTITKVMIWGEEAPELGGTFAQPSFNLDLNDRGQVAFRGVISGGSKSLAIWAYSDGVLKPVIVAYDDVPSGTLGYPFLNNQGQIAWRDYGARKIFLADVPHLCPDGSCGGPPPPAQVDRDIVFVRGIDSVGDCERADEWVEEYLESSTGNPFWGKVRIGKYLHFDYLSGGSYDCPRDDNAYTKADTCDGVARAAGELKGLIEAQATAQVTIVAHSMGGLVAAYLVGNPEWSAWAESHIASVVTIDGTLRGISDIDAWLLEYPSVCSLDWPTPSASLLELVETSSVVEKAATAAEKVPFYPMDATQFPNYVPRERSTLDGARPFSLTNWCEQPGADEQECEPPRPIDDDHSSSWDRRFDEHGENDKAFLVGCAVSVMVDCAFMSASALQGMTTETHADMGPTATQVRIVSNYGSIVRMTLISPDGTVYGPDGAGPLLAYGVDEVSETYVIGNPAPGDWTIQLFGEDVDPGGEEVLLALLVEEASEDADFDTDGFTNFVEQYIGTDPLDDCTDEIGAHDAWPLDINMDQAVTVVGDALNFRGRIGAAPGSPEWWQRLDLNTDGAITVVGDALLYRGMIGASCI